MPLINRVLDFIPNRINIPGTALHIDLGFSSNIECKDQSHLTLPMSITLQSDVTPFTEPNFPNFPPYSNQTYEIEAAISEYFIDNLLYELHKNDLIVIDTGDLLGNVLTVGWLSLGTGGNFASFDNDAPCKAILISLDPYP